MNNATKVSINNAKTWQLTKSLWKSLLQSGQALFSTLKLRSEGLVPSSGAQSAPQNSTYGSSTARLFLPRYALQPETRGRCAPRFAH